MWSRALLRLRPLGQRTLRELATPRVRFLALSGAAVFVLAVSFAEVARAIVRERVRSSAGARGMVATIGSVRLGWFDVTLRDLQLTKAGGPLSLTMHDVRVELSGTLRVSRLELRGVDAQVDGSPEAVEQMLRGWKRSDGAVSASSPRASVTATDVSVRWQSSGPNGFSVASVGGSLQKSQDGWSISFSSIHAHQENVSIDVSVPVARLDSSGALIDGRASRIAVTLASEGEQVDPGVASASGEPSPPPLPPSGGPPDDADDGTLAGRRFRLPDLSALRARLAVAGALLQRQLADGAIAEVDSLAFEVGEGERRLAIGHGPARALRQGNQLELTFSTQVDASGTPVSVSATLPLTGGDATVVLAGGPVSLGLLGVEEGVGGLVDVARTSVSGRGRVSFGGNGESGLTFDGEVSVRDLSVNRPSLASEAVRGVDATLLARGALDEHGALRIDDGEIAVGALRAVGHGVAEQTPDHTEASLSFELPVAQCESLLRSIPSALVPTLDGAEVSGTFGARGRLAFDSRHLDDLVLDWKVDDDCSMVLVPESIAKERFSQAFEHTVYLADGTLGQQTTGPGTENWTELARISPFMQVAVLTTEDGAFYRHHGFNRAAMRNALVADLKAGRFVRGASTITMQLAKNLFLFRDKTLSRKLEELVLADYIDETFSKRETMELYLNVIEFGPDVYGITQAAFHYFGRKPDELNLAESIFLASLLPSPIRFHKLAEKPQLSEGWTRHLRQLMTLAAKNDLLSPEELAAGLREEVFFHDEKDPLPAPRPAVTGTHFQPPVEETFTDDGASEPRIR